MKKILLPTLFLLISHLAFSQQGSLAHQRLGDSLYHDHHYQDAIVYYQKALRNSPNAGEVMLQIAKSYGKINDADDAEKWFEQAHANHAKFSSSDTYEYVRILRMLKKHDVAESILERVVAEDPNALVARQALDDIQNATKYYKDSTAFTAKPLSINTPESEFAPAYYRDGIVFTSARQEKFARQKYHWDDSDYLNLYFSKIDSSGAWQAPVLFERELNTKYHDGPATFYNNNERMVVNRNEATKSKEKDDLWVWHIALYDGQYTASTGTWLVTKMPFDQPPYSFAHPAVVDGGNVLYFVSDIPGGYGGTDIYKVMRKNGVWTKPYNLGPAINTPGNEVFPFVVNNTLYFSSTGHGGLGGLDIFKSTVTKNGFSPAENMGYPFNSIADDFSLIATADFETGYFASNRRGNDDLFSFDKSAPPIPMLAHIYDGVTQQSLAGAEIQMITSTGGDVTLTSDENGEVAFELIPETTYMIIGSKDGKVGMLTGTASAEGDRTHMTHQIPVYGDTARIACIGVIKDESGIPQNAAKITIIDETTGKKLEHANGQSVVNFLGEKNHTYRIEIENDKGDVTVQTVSIGADEKSSKTWNMVLKPSVTTLTFAAQVIKADDKTPLGGADVKIITFSEPDQTMVADAEGKVEFSVQEGTAYMVVGTKDELTGMYAGMAERGMDKSVVTHPVPAHGDPKNPVTVASLVTDSKGEVIQDAKAIVTEKATGKTISAQVENGVLSFLGERGKDYNIAVEKEGYITTLQEITIMGDADPVQKGSIALAPVEPVIEKPAICTMTAHIFRANDLKSMNGAEVKILNFAEAGDLVLKADGAGLATFSLPEGTAFIIIGSKDGYIGMYSGTVEKGTCQSSIVYPVAARNEPQKHLPIMVRVNDQKGVLLKDASISVIDQSTGETIPAIVKDGIVSFSGEPGKKYSIGVNHDGFNPAVETVAIPSNSNSPEKVVIALQPNGVLNGNQLSPVAVNSDSQKNVPMMVRVNDQKGMPIQGASVTVIDQTTGETVPSTFKDGVLTFSGEPGKKYSIGVNHDDFHPAVETITVPSNSSAAEKVAITLQPKDLVHAQNQTSTGANQNSSNLTGAAPTAVATTQTSNGTGASGKPGDGLLASAVVGTSALFAEDQAMTKNQVPISALVKDDNGAVLTNGEVVVVNKLTGEEVPATFNYGVINFTGEKGADYAVEVRSANVNAVSESFTIPKTIDNTDEQMFVVLEENQNEGKDVLNALITDRQGLTDSGIMVSDETLDDAIAEAKKAHVLSKEAYTDAVASNAANMVDMSIDLTDTQDNLISQAMVTVTEKSTGNEIQATVQDGAINFDGKKGEEYAVKVEGMGFATTTKDVVVPSTGVATKQAIQVEKNITEPVFYSMTARVFKAGDKTPLGGAMVSILNIVEPDLEITANSEGIAEFSLPEGTAFVVIGSKDGFTGMFSGEAEPGTDKSMMVCPVPAYSDSDKHTQVVTLITDNQGSVIQDAEAQVSDKATGQIVPSESNNGVLSFVAEKGKEYNVEVKAEGHETTEKTIEVSAQATGVQSHQMDLTPVSGASASKVSDLIVLNADGESAKFYLVLEDGQIEQLVERNGKIYAQRDGSLRLIGDGTLADVQKNPSAFLEKLSLTSEHMVNIGNIYFDFNSAALKSEGKSELDKVKDVFQRYPALRLDIGTHADDRGKAAYNLNLSKKRAKSIETYLEKQDIPGERVKLVAFGETAPAVSCATCTEDEHRKNRRAEFALGSGVRNKNVRKSSRASAKNNEEMMEIYGDFQKEGLLFKVSVGAYRYNSTLTFDDLKDLGTVEVDQSGGITYYYISGFPTWREAFKVRAQIIERGVSDAAITIFYNNEKISFKEFKALKD